MSQQETREVVGTVVERGKELVARGNKRHVVLRNKDGEQIADVSLTIAVIIGAFLFFTPWGWPVLLIAVIGGVIAKVRIELVHELDETDDTIQVQATDE